MSSNDTTAVLHYNAGQLAALTLVGPPMPSNDPGKALFRETRFDFGEAGITKTVSIASYTLNSDRPLGIEDCFAIGRPKAAISREAVSLDDVRAATGAAASVYSDTPQDGFARAAKPQLSEALTGYSDAQAGKAAAAARDAQAAREAKAAQEAQQAREAAAAKAAQDGVKRKTDVMAYTLWQYEAQSATNTSRLGLIVNVSGRCVGEEKTIRDITSGKLRPMDYHTSKPELLRISPENESRIPSYVYERRNPNVTQYYYTCRVDIDPRDEAKTRAVDEYFRQTLTKGKFITNVNALEFEKAVEARRPKQPAAQLVEAADEAGKAAQPERPAARSGGYSR